MTVSVHTTAGHFYTGTVDDVLVGPSGEPQVVYLRGSEGFPHGFVSIPWHAVEYVCRA